MKLKKIELIEVGLTSICNLKCPLCTRSKIKFKDKKNTKYSNNQFIDYIKLIDFIDILPNLKAVKFIGAVGEPTLHPAFTFIMKILKYKNIKAIISTNGCTHDNHWWKVLGEALPNNSEVLFDIDHTEKEKQNFYRRGSNLETILHNSFFLKMGLKKYQPKNTSKLIIQRIDFDWNKDNLKDMQRKVHGAFEPIRFEPHSEWLQFDRVETIPCYWFDEKEFNEKNLGTTYNSPAQSVQNKLKLLTDIRVEKTKFKDYHKLNIQCESLNNKALYINYIGEIHSCCYINDEALKNTKKYININDNPHVRTKHPKSIDGVKLHNFITETETWLENQMNQDTNNEFNLTCAKYCNNQCRKMYKNFNLDP